MKSILKIAVSVAVLATLTACGGTIQTAGGTRFGVAVAPSVTVVPSRPRYYDDGGTTVTTVRRTYY